MTTLWCVTDHVMAGAEPTYSPGDVAGVLLLHDLAGTPQIMRNLTEALCAADMAVDVPLLPGHGTNIEDLEGTTWDDWAAAAQLALDELASRSGPIVVVGMSMGAALACFVSAFHPSVVGVVAINPRAMPVPNEAIEMLQAMERDGYATVPPLGIDVSDRRAQVLAYDTVPVSTLISMFEALGSMEEHWHDVTLPLQIITSARDHRVSPMNGDWMADRVKGPVERVTLERSFHEATVDVDHEQLEASVIDFVRRLTANETDTDTDAS